MARRRAGRRRTALVRSAWAVGLGLAVAVARTARRYSLRGRVVLLTGGSRGLGLYMARVFAGRGAKLVLLARDVAELGVAREELRALGAEVLALPCDVTDRGDVRRAVTAAVDWFGRIDVLVNDAGVIEVGPLETMTEDDFGIAMATHFGGALHLVNELLPGMIARGEGRIVNIASIGGRVPVPHLAPYCASKFALVGFSEALRVELAKTGVVVTTVCPGLMRTGSGRAALLKGNVEAENAWFRPSAVLPGMSMSAERAARRIVRACELGLGHVVVGFPAKILALAYALAPGLFGRAMALANRALPAPIEREFARDPVRAAAVPLRSSWVGRLDERYARAGNEAGGRSPG